MPRNSPFAIELTEEEAKVLQKRARKYTLPYFQVLRAQMILLAADGLRNDEIAARLNTCREVVSQWRKRFFFERLPGLEERSRPGRPRAFYPPPVVAQVKALACELPAHRGLPLSRMSTADVAREVRTCGIVASISDKTVWRWLHEDAIRPWQHRCWIFPRDPEFRAKAGRILDLYEGHWEGTPLRDDEFVISTDEKTSIQARRRIHTPLATSAGRPMRCEHEYERKGAWAYLAARDVRRAKIFGRCEPKTGIVPFGRLMKDVMSQEPYRSARRVFWTMDNGSSHRGETSIERITNQWPTVVPVHTPVHASWLNQVEIYFSVLQRKALTPNDFPSLAVLEERLHGFARYYESIAKPFEWKFTRRDLESLLARIDRRRAVNAPLAPAA